jgi:hypothetical protein
VIALALLLMLAATAMFTAAALRPEGVVATVLAAYLVLVVEATALTTLLSAFQAVTRTGLAVGLGAFLVCAIAFWWHRDRPGLGIDPGIRAIRQIVGDPFVAAFLVFVAVALIYELVLVLTVPANNWDSLTYHLARVAAWTQHHGVYWVDNAPTDRINEFQPVAEQQILFLFVATGKGALFALPQFVAQLAIMVSIYGSARRLEFSAPAAACAALLFTTFTVVALEATTSQNDLVAASLPATATTLLLGNGPVTAVLAGVAVGLGLGVKLTTALVVPVLAVLALRSGRSRALLAGLGTIAAFFALAIWGFVLNIVHTGHVLGHGGGRIDETTSPSFPGSGITLIRICFRLLDLTGFTFHLLVVATGAGAACAVGLLVARRRRGGSLLDKHLIPTVLVLFTPVLVLGAANHIHELINAARPGTLGPPNRLVNEDYSAFGPIDGLALVAAAALTGISAARRGRDKRTLVLAATLPLYVIVLALTSKYNPWLSRFLIVPAAITAPLLARLFGRKGLSFAIAGVAVLSLAITLESNHLKPLHSAFGRPWNLTQSDAVKLNWKPEAGIALDALNRQVPSRACIGAALGSNEPSYLIYGRSLQRRVVYLPLKDSVQAAQENRLRYVVISESERLLAANFASAGWSLRALNPPGPRYWELAVSSQQKIKPTAARECAQPRRGT